MNEIEAIKVIKDKACNDRCSKEIKCDDSCLYGEGKCAFSIAIKALEEIQKYRNIGTVEELKQIKENGAFTGIELATIASNLFTLQAYQDIGTVEECRESIERMKPKKVKKIQIPNTSWSKACTRFECPSCNKYLNYMELSHCGLCGQCLDWSE